MKGSTRKISIKWLAIFVAIAFILCISYFIAGSVIRNRIAQSLRVLSPNIQSSYSSIHVNLFASSVSVDGLQIYFVPYHSLEQHRHFLYFKETTLSGISFFKLILDKKLLISHVEIGGAKIKLDQFLLDKKDSAQQSILNHVAIPFKNITTRNLTLEDLSVWLSTDTVEALLRGNISMYDQEIFVSNTSIDSFHLGNFNCSLRDIHYPLPGRFHTLHIGKLKIDSEKEMLRMDSVKVIPLLSKQELGRRLGRQVDWINASISKIELTKLNMVALMHDNLLADKLILSDCDVHVFRDRKLPRKEVNQPMLNDYLNKIPWDVRISTFKIDNANILSEEMPKEGMKTGFLKIGKVNVSMSPVLNHPGKNVSGSSDTYVEGSIMNSGILKAHIRAPFRENVYTIKGSIKDLDLSKLNPSAENLGKFHVESGVLNDLDFHFVATEEKATGEIVGEYHNLVLEKLKIEDGKKKIATVPTFFLKHLIIPKNKDKSLDVAERTGKIDFKRDPTRVVTFYFLKSLLDGIRDSFDLGFLLPK